MGLLVQTSFETPEGISISGIYCRITGISSDFLSSTEVRIQIKNQTFISRDKRLAGSMPIRVPAFPEYTSILASPSDPWSSSAFLYAALKNNLQSSGFTVEDVFEEPSA